MQTNILILSILVILLSVTRVLGHLTENISKVNEKVQRSVNKFENEDKYMNTSQLLTKYGYPVQEYSVTTEDGFILTLVRVPRAGPVVFILHGILSSSDDFITSGPHNALVYLLSNASYDVWLGNARGNKYSKRHVRLFPHERQFWEFTWHEIGYYDLPAMIDFALATSNRSQLVYIGHSQGTTSFFVLCSERPEYNKKISFAFSLATVAYTWHSSSPVRKLLSPFADVAYATAYGIGLYELLPFDTFRFVTSVLCDLTNTTRLACSTALFTVFGFDYPQIDHTHLPVQIAHVPAGAAFKQVTHILQTTNSKRFAQFDHGTRKNMEVYGTPKPPDYPVKKITVPISIFYSLNDKLSSFEDVKILIRELPNVKDVYRIPLHSFNHIDYMWAKDAKTLVYLRIVNMIDKLVQH